MKDEKEEIFLVGSPGPPALVLDLLPQTGCPDFESLRASHLEAALSVVVVT